MCAGIRDAANLAWKLDLVARRPRARRAARHLRRGAAAERPPGDRVLDGARQGDLRARRRRGRRARRGHGRRGDRRARREAPELPGIDAGCIDASDARTPGGCSSRARSTVGPSTTSTAPAGGSSPIDRRTPTRSTDDLAAGSRRSAGASSLAEPPTPRTPRWFAEHDAAWALQRPDFHLYGTADHGRRRHRPRSPTSATDLRPRPRHHRKCPVKIANVNDRAVLVLGDEIADIASASDGRFGPDPMAVYDDWDAFAAFAATRHRRHRARSSRPTSAARCPARARCSPSASTTGSHAEESGMAVPEVPATFTKFPASLGGPVRRHRDRRRAASTGRSSSSRSSAGAPTASPRPTAGPTSPGSPSGQDISDRHLQFAAGAQFSLGQVPPGLRPDGAVGRHPRRGRRPRRPRARLLGRRRGRAGRPHQRPHLRRPAARRRAVGGAARCCRATSSSPARPPASAWPASRARFLRPARCSRPGSRASARSATAASDHRLPAPVPDDRGAAMSTTAPTAKEPKAVRVAARRPPQHAAARAAWPRGPRGDLPGARHHAPAVRRAVVAVPRRGPRRRRPDRYRRRRPAQPGVGHHPPHRPARAQPTRGATPEPGRPAQRARAGHGGRPARVRRR